MTKPEHRAMTVQELINSVGDIPNWNTKVYIDIGSTNSYKVVKAIQVRNNHLILVTGEKSPHVKR